MSNVVKAHLGLILSYVIWAVNYPLYKVIMPHYISPYAMTMLVVGVAALLAFGSMLFVPIEPVRRQDILKLVAAAALMGIAKKLFLMVGIQHTSPIDASIIATLGPILVLVISVMFLVDRFTPMKVLGMALGLAGALVVILSGSGMQAPSDKLGGDAVVLLAIVASSFSMVWLKELIMRYKPVTLLRWIYPVAAVMMLPIGLGPLLRTDFSAMPAHVAWIVAYVAVVPTFGPNYLLIYSLHYVKPASISIWSPSSRRRFPWRCIWTRCRGTARWPLWRYSPAFCSSCFPIRTVPRRRAIPGSSPVLRAVAFLRVGERPSVRASGCVAGAIGRSSN